MGLFGWLNQKLGNFLGDFKKERKLNEEPEACHCRAIFRALLALILAAGAIVAFILLFRAAPNVRVARIYLQKDHTNYAIQRLYNSSASFGGDIDAQQKLVDATLKGLSDQFGVVTNYTSSSDANAGDETEVLGCPCTTTTISWIDYVHFYSLNYTPPVPFLNFSQGDLPPPTDNVLLDTSGANQTADARYLTKEANLTWDRFCEQIEVLPPRYRPTSIFLDCPNLVAALLTTEPQPENLRTNWNDPRISYFESPNLLNQKFLYSNTLRRLNAYQREQYTLLSAIQPFQGENATHRNMLLTGLTDIWLYALDRFAANSSTTELDFWMSAAIRTTSRFFERVDFYSEYFAINMNDGNTFLGMEVSWPEYYNICRPSYCDVTRKSNAWYRSYTVLAVLGGLANLAILPTQLIVWPLIALSLVRCFKGLKWCSKKKKQKTSSLGP